jgi:hypothetical protein
VSAAPGQRARARGSDGRWMPPPPGSRSSAEVRRDIVRQREELSQSIEVLRTRIARITDVRTQIRAHRTEIVVGAAVVGFLIGGAIALGRRRG